MTTNGRAAVVSPAERLHAERMVEARNQICRIVAPFDGTDPLVILESAIAVMIRDRCRGAMHKAAELVGEHVVEKIRKQAPR